MLRVFKKTLPLAIVAALMLSCAMCAVAWADDTIGVSDPAKRAWTSSDGEHVKVKDLFATERVSITLPVKDASGNSVNGVNFQIWNATTQTNEAEVTSANGQITLSLINGHNYIFFPMDTKWEGKTYVWVRDGKLVSTKSLEENTKTWSYPEVSQVTLTQRATELSSVDDARRKSFTWYLMRDQETIYMNPKSVKFVSQYETVEGTVRAIGSNSTVTANLLEDVDYLIVYDEGGTSLYVETVPLTYKDKSEYSAQYIKEHYPYLSFDHRCCQSITYLALIPTSEKGTRWNRIQTLDGKTTIGGMDFIDENSGRYPFVHVKDVTSDYKNLGLANYQAFSILAENTARSETMKMTGIDFEITQVVDDGKKVEKVYEIKDGKLEENFQFYQAGNYVTFTTDSLSMYPVVFQYAETAQLNKTVTFNVVNESNKAASGVELNLKTEHTLYSLDPTNAYGQVTFTLDATAQAGTYQVTLPEDSRYELIGSNSFEVREVDGQTYIPDDQSTITVKVKVPAAVSKLNLKVVKYDDSPAAGARMEVRMGSKTVQMNSASADGTTSIDLSSYLPASGTEEWTVTTPEGAAWPASLAMTIKVDPDGIVNYQEVYTFEVRTPVLVQFNMNGHGASVSYQNPLVYSMLTKPADPTASGWTFGGWYKEAACTNAWDFSRDTVEGDMTLYAKWTKAEVSTQPMYRLYNHYTGDHLFTTDETEYNALQGLGWTGERKVWDCPTSGPDANQVYRLYNPFSGDHHYTKDVNEYNALQRIGWNGEGVKFYSADESGVPVYRLFNPWLKVGTHLYTKDVNEYNKLASLGWQKEDISFYGVK